MKILIYAIGSRGDVQPFIALGRAAVARGHDALLQEPEVQAALTSLGGKLKAYRWASELMNAQLSAVWDIGFTVKPDIILNHFKASLAPHIARALGIPSVPVALQPGFVPTGAYPQFLMGAEGHNRAWNRFTHRAVMGAMRLGTGMMHRRWRRATGIDIGARMDTLGGYVPGGEAVSLQAYSSTLVPRPHDWPESAIQTGYFFGTPDDWTPPDDLASFLDDGPPPVYAGFGSMPGIDHARTTRALLGALEATGRRAVLATGWGGISGVETGADIHVLKAAPHGWLFPRVSAVVHHGGSGTTHEGLRWGRPSVICPLFADQPYFGARVAALGAGPAPIRQRDLTAEALAAAIEVAHLPEVVARAAEIGAAMRAEDGVGRALAVVEGLVRSNDAPRPE